MITINVPINDDLAKRKDALNSRENPFTWQDAIKLGITAGEKKASKKKAA